MNPGVDRPVQARHGVALLMALATLMLVLAGIAAALAAMRGAGQSARASDVDARLLAGLRQGERIAIAWLQSASAQAVLPPEGGGIPLVDDRFVLPSGEGRLSIVAYDGLAGLPASLAQRGNALRAALPGPLLALAIPPLKPAAAGQPSALIDSLELPDDVRRYPQPFQGRGRMWRSIDAIGTPGSDPPASLDPSLAESIAFLSDGSINLNTAPAPLLRAAYASLGIGGIDDLLKRRQLLQPSRLPEGQRNADGLRLVAQSDRWQMLITVGWQGIHRSWWVVFAGKSQTFSMVQRHDVSN